MFLYIAYIDLIIRKKTLWKQGKRQNISNYRSIKVLNITVVNREWPTSVFAVVRVSLRPHSHVFHSLWASLNIESHLNYNSSPFNGIETVTLMVSIIFFRYRNSPFNGIETVTLMVSINFFRYRNSPFNGIN